MTTQTVSYVDAVRHLPAGGTLILTDVSWAEYEGLLVELGDSNSVRISYDHGRLQIMSPSQYHEMYKELILRLVSVIADDVGLPLESRGSTTFKQESFAQGAEPDTCFYVQNAERIIGKRQLDFSIDPPPDVIVEIDVSHESTGKFAFYARLGVPEVWFYDERQARIYHLTEQGYAEATLSRAFPPLTADALSRFLEQSKTAGQSRTLQSFRDWLRTRQWAGV